MVASDPIGPLVMVELSSHSVAWLAVGVANLLLSSTQACQDIAARAEGPRWRLAEPASRNALLLADARAPATSRRPAVEI